MKHTLEVDSVQLAFENRSVLSSVYLKVETGQIVGLLGRNGTGKSCLLRIFFGSLATECSVRVNSKPAAPLYKNPFGAGFLPQDNFVPRELSLKQVFWQYNLNKCQFFDWFPEFAEYSNLQVGRLSGGERKILELYLVLNQPHPFILLDEPFCSLGPIQIERMKKLLANAREEKGILITDHLYEHVMELSDRLYVLHKGTVSPAASIEDLVSFGYLRS